MGSATSARFLAPRQSRSLRGEGERGCHFETHWSLRGEGREAFILKPTGLYMVKGEQEKSDSEGRGFHSETHWSQRGVGRTGEFRQRGRGFFFNTHWSLCGVGRTGEFRQRGEIFLPFLFSFMFVI